MATKGRVTLGLVIMLSIVAGSASAFDNQRTGLCFGLGVGLGFAGFGESNSESITGIHSTLDLGGGISEQLLILYSGHTTFYRIRSSNLVWATPTVVARYYFKPTVPSFYVFGGPAISAGAAWDGSEGGAGFGGFGLTGGGGYQASRRFQIQVGGVTTSRYSSSFNSVHATVNLVMF